MNPIEFKEQNMVFTAPNGWSEEECGSLHVCNTDGILVSCWKLTWKERIMALLFGKIWLGIYGSGHPPVWLECNRTVFGGGKENV